MTDALTPIALWFVGMLPVAYALIALVGWVADTELERNRATRAVGVCVAVVALLAPGVVAMDVLTSPDRGRFTDYVTGLILLSFVGLAPWPLLGRRAEANMRGGRPTVVNRLLAAVWGGLTWLVGKLGVFGLPLLIAPCFVFLFGSTSLLRSFYEMLVDDRYEAHEPWSLTVWTMGALIALVSSLVIASYVDGRKIDHLVRSRRSGDRPLTDPE